MERRKALAAATRGDASSSGSSIVAAASMTGASFLGFGGGSSGHGRLGRASTVPNRARSSRPATSTTGTSWTPGPARPTARRTAFAVGNRPVSAGSGTTRDHPPEPRRRARSGPRRSRDDTHDEAQAVEPSTTGNDAHAEAARRTDEPGESPTPTTVAARRRRRARRRVPTTTTTWPAACPGTGRRTSRSRRCRRTARNRSSRTTACGTASTEGPPMTEPNSDLEARLARLAARKAAARCHDPTAHAAATADARDRAGPEPQPSRRGVTARSSMT